MKIKNLVELNMKTSSYHAAVVLLISDCPIVFEHERDTFDSNLPEVDLMMSPVKTFKDPFRKGNNKIVLCQVLYPDGSPPRK